MFINPGVILLCLRQNFLKVFLSYVPVGIKALFEICQDFIIRPPLHIQGARYPDPAGGIIRQGMNLFLIRHLQAVFQSAQEQVGSPDLPFVFRADKIQLAQALQHLQGIGRAQFGVPCRTDQLQYLDKKLDVPDAAPAQLDVPLAAARPDPGHFPLDSHKPLQVRGTHGTYEHKGTQPGEEFLAKHFIARNTAGA